MRRRPRVLVRGRSISAGPGRREQGGYEEAKRQVAQTGTEAGREAGAS